MLTIMNIQPIKRFATSLRHKLLMLGLGACACAAASPALAVPPPPNEKCDVEMSFEFDPGTTVADGTDVTLTQEVIVESEGSGTLDCGLEVDDPVNGGNAQIQAVTLAGDGRPCADLDASFCTAGLTGDSCSVDVDCDTEEAAGDGVCTAVGTTSLAHENPTDGSQEVIVDTTGLGGSVLGFVAQYTGGGTFENAPQICTDLTVVSVEEGACEGATISIDRASGPGEPAAPGGPYDWSFRVTVHACEDLYGVSAQGGTNGWAQLVDRSESSLDPSAGVTEIRKANKKTDVILWTIGDMDEGQTETLDVDLSGSLKGAPDCDERFLSGPWSALFSLDSFTFEKTDYTGRVSIFTNSNGVEGDCE